MYELGIRLFDVVLLLASPFHKKAALLRKGRREVWATLKRYVNNHKCIWIHAASLGEFEQGRPLIEAIKARDPKCKVVLTFFSPSGYEVRKNYALADLVCYLPADTRGNARRFVNVLNPRMVFFIKYEFWHHYLSELHRKQIPVYGVSVIFRPDQVFFKPYGGWYRKLLLRFTYLYLQDDTSAALLDRIGMTHYTVAGDTRFDRVAKIARQSAEVEVAAKFSRGARTIVAGSTWGPDEELLVNYLNEAPEDVKLILAPHEIDETHVRQILTRLKVPYFRYSKQPADPENYRMMVVDTIGLLSAIYKYGQIAYVGGGFGKGIHNTIEAATYGMPVVWGPHYRKFKEATDLVACGAGHVISSQQELNAVLDKLWRNSDALTQSGKAAEAYVHSQCGATDQILTDVFS